MREASFPFAVQLSLKTLKDKGADLDTLCAVKKCKSSSNFF